MFSDVVIAARGLSKSFPIYEKPHHRLFQMLVPRRHKQRWSREFRALKGIDLTVRRGETVGIVGRNGSGKSTLLQILCGTLTPTCGEVEVKGRIAALLELGSGFNPEFTGRENVFLYGALLGFSRADIDARFDSIAAFAQIGDFLEQPVKTYSSGMHVRLAFAVAINVEPEILVVDEALGVGDEAFQRKCYARIERIRDAGATVLFVSHSASTVVDLCDRAVLLDDGELLAEGAPKQVVALYQKLIYSPPERYRQLRDEIRSGGGGLIRAAEGDIAADACQADRNGQPECDESHWDEGLVPSSTLRYESRGAVIGDPHLETVAGRRVNVLWPGGEYVYVYRVRAERTLTSVRCGMMIRTITGVEVSGAVSGLREHAMPVVQAGATLEVRFRFRCMLAPGTYFMNAGVLADLDGSEDFADRIIDGVMFRVLSDRGRLATGLVDLDFKPEVRCLERQVAGSGPD